MKQDSKIGKLGPRRSGKEACGWTHVSRQTPSVKSFPSHVTGHSRRGTKQPSSKDGLSSSCQIASVTGHPVLGKWAHEQNGYVGKDGG